jgi:hypothetical protein
MTDTRTAYIKNLFDLATLLDNNPDIPIQYSQGRGSQLTWYVHDSVETVLAIRELIEDPLTLPYTSNDFPVEITGILAGFPVSVLVARGIALAGAPAREAYPMNPRLLEPVKA